MNKVVIYIRTRGEGSYSDPSKDKISRKIQGIDFVKRGLSTTSARLGKIIFSVNTSVKGDLYNKTWVSHCVFQYRLSSRRSLSRRVVSSRCNKQSKINVFCQKSIRLAPEHLFQGIEI